MACDICTWTIALALNVLNLGDHAINTVALGDADETVSARVSRARNAGRQWAVVACDGLTVAQYAVTLGQMPGDHCTYALDKSIKPNTAEILNLDRDPPALRRNPINKSSD